MSKSRYTVLLKVMLSAGIFLFIANSVFFYIDIPNVLSLYLILASFIIQVVLGIFIILFSLKYTKKAYQFFIGEILSGWGIISGLITFVLPYNDKYWWPLYLIGASIFLFTAGKMRYKEIKFGYLVPSIALICMGIWFALFTFKLVRIPFRAVVVLIGPAFIVLIAILFLLVFLIQRRHKQLVINDDEYGDFDDEEFAGPKLD